MMSVFLSYITWFVSDIFFFDNFAISRYTHTRFCFGFVKMLQCLYAYWSIYALNSCFPNINFSMVVTL
jgi:hypothetical protein